jgi:hypothetical protein
MPDWLGRLNPKSRDHHTVDFKELDKLTGWVDTTFLKPDHTLRWIA